MLQAIGKNLVIRPVRNEEKKSTLILTTQEEKPVFFEVISIGNDVKEVSVGDTIWLQHYNRSSEITFDDVKYYMVNIDSICAKKIE
jgi:co-chaperonin GroES (HSP10)